MQAPEANGAGNDDGGGVRGAKKRRRTWEEGSDEDAAGGPDSEDEAEAQRLADQREKEAFEERLRAKDEARTRKIAEAKLSAEELRVRALHSSAQAAACCCDIRGRRASPVWDQNQH